MEIHGERDSFSGWGLCVNNFDCYLCGCACGKARDGIHANRSFAFLVNAIGDENALRR